jgi:hypothetical protein
MNGRSRLGSPSATLEPLAGPGKERCVADTEASDSVHKMKGKSIFAERLYTG